MTDQNRVHGNLIGDEWIEDGETILNENPSDLDDPVGVYANASVDQVDAAVAAARDGFSRWSRATAQQRADALESTGNALLARKDELGRQLSREEGKPLMEGIGEVTRAAQIFKWFAGEALRQHGDRMAGLRPGTEMEVIREPLGVVAVITPWNFPIGVAAWKIAPALACGNAVVFKPSEIVPASGWSLAEILYDQDLPPGTINLLMGNGEIGGALVAHKDVAAVTFTGSTKTGRAIANSAAERFCRIQLEMGGKNPLIVLKDADLDLAVECALNGAFLSTGQRCTASSRLIVEEDVHDAFVEKLTTRLKTINTDHALKLGVDNGPVVSQTQLDHDLVFIDVGQKEGAKLAFGGDVLTRGTRGYYLNCALFTETDNNMRINREEIFGPIASVIKVRNYDEALAAANDTEYGLTASIITRSLKYASHFKRNIQSGVAVVNLPTAGVDYSAPFGGRKNSSYGPRETGEAAREFFSTTKTAYTRPE